MKKDNINSGFCAIGIHNFNNECNVGTLWRSALAFGANYLFTIGRKYKKQASDTPNSSLNLPLFNYPCLDDFLAHIPHNTRLVCIENKKAKWPLQQFVHPDRAIYLLGNEGQGLPDKLLDKHLVVEIPSALCLNVSTAGSIVLYDRISKINIKETI